MFPHLLDLRIEGVTAAGRSVRVQATAHDRAVACPTCGYVARRVHSRYERRLSDLMVGGRETVIHLRVRRLFNRIKMIKRQMYGRANPDLLRKRILLAD